MVGGLCDDDDDVDVPPGMAWHGMGGPGCFVG